ncbi:MAG: hypothetical protein NWE95_13380 [Candidatus Bathyarchaeota archaeon]|nr:hypothetical protein [Candidatus Bathyarchaeota archaeon]
MTKHVHDELKCSLSIEDAKVEVAPEIIDNSVVIAGPRIVRKPKGKVKVRMVKAKVTAKKSGLEKATSQLYDLEEECVPEKPLNIDFGLYQMEDY